MNSRALWTACLAVLTCAAALEAQVVTLRDTAVLRAPRLREASGIAASRRQPGVYWTHNDSGDEPFLYATDSAGTDRGRIRIAGASARDWEDIEIGPCVVVPGDCLYVADTGDNFAQRTSVVVYRLREPAAPAGAFDTLRTTPLLDSIVLRYPGGPRDAEALGITPDGMLFLVEKSRFDAPRAYRLNLAASRRGSWLSDLGTLPIETSLLHGRIVTGGAVSPDGRRLVLRTYVSLHFYRVTRDGRLESESPLAGVGIPVVESQGEGISFHGDSTLVLISERAQSNHAIVSRLSLAPAGP